MRRDFSKKQSSIKKNIPWPRVMVFALVFVLLAGCITFVYQQRNQRMQVVAATFVELKTWITEHTSRVHQQIKAAKQQLAIKDTAPPEIHFEFYTALPKMQVEVEQADNKKLTPVTMAVSEKVLSHKDVLVTPSELEKEVSQHIQTANYSLQVGLFKSPDLAAAFQASLSQKGFSAKVSKITLGKKDWYRVQYGSFATKDEAKASQLKLQKKGINAILHKEVTF